MKKKLQGLDSGLIEIFMEINPFLNMRSSKIINRVSVEASIDCIQEFSIR